MRMVRIEMIVIFRLLTFGELVGMSCLVALSAIEYNAHTHEQRLMRQPDNGDMKFR